MERQFIRLDNRTLLTIVNSLNGTSSLNEAQRAASIHDSLLVLHENHMLRDALCEFLQLDLRVHEIHTEQRNSWGHAGFLRLFHKQALVGYQQLLEQRGLAFDQYELIRKLVDHTNLSLIVSLS